MFLVPFYLYPEDIEESLKKQTVPTESSSASGTFPPSWPTLPLTTVRHVLRFCDGNRTLAAVFRLYAAAAAAPAAASEGTTARGAGTGDGARDDTPATRALAAAGPGDEDAHARLQRLFVADVQSVWAMLEPMGLLVASLTPLPCLWDHSYK